MSEIKSDMLLENNNLRECCGEKPVFHQFTSLNCWAIECRVNGHIHNTGLCKSQEEAIEKWEDGDIAE